VDACIVECVAEVLSRGASVSRDERLTTLAGCRDAVELTQRALLADRAHASRVVTAAKGVRREPQLDGSLQSARYEALREALLSGDLTVAGFLAATQELDRAGARIGAADRKLADAELGAIARGAGYVPVVGDEAVANTDDEVTETHLGAVIPVRPLPEDLRRCAERVLAHLDPDGAEPRDREASSRRGIRLGAARDGLVPISGRLETSVAAGFLRIVDAIEKPKGKQACVEFTDPTAAADIPESAGAGDLPVFPKRLREQILHDVFATVVNVAARSEEMPALGGAAPTLVVSIDVETLANGAGYADLESADLVTTYAVAEQTACTGVIQRVFQDRGRIIRMETTERVFNAAQRRAIIRRDRECIIPGCHVNANWCEIHHILEHALGGPTHTDNGVLVCFHHHRTLHCGGWSIRMREGRPEVRGPAGWDPSRAWRVPDSRPYRSNWRGRAAGRECHADRPVPRGPSASPGRMEPPERSEPGESAVRSATPMSAPGFDATGTPARAQSPRASGPPASPRWARLPGRR